MADFKQLLGRIKKGPTDVVGIDVGATGIKLVRIRKSDDALTLVSAGILPPLPVPGAADDPAQKPTVRPLVFPPALKARYASLAFSGSKAVIKLLSFPGSVDSIEDKIVENLGVENVDKFRIGYKAITEGHGRGESRILAVAMPEAEGERVNQLLPTGLPAPCSLEISGLATLTCFLNGTGLDYKEAPVGVVEFGAQTTTFALLNKHILSLVRRFDFGTNSILQEVRHTLGVDMETAQGILSDGSFDISQSVSRVMEPLLKQLTVSRDFVERRENCHFDTLFLSGGLATSRDCVDEIHSALGMETRQWNPFEKLNMNTDAVPQEYTGQEWRFAAAIGACIGTFETT